MLTEVLRTAILTALSLLYLTLCAVAVTVALSRADGPAYQMAGATLGFFLLLLGFAVIQGVP